MNERPLWVMLEDAFLIVSIAALWPGILGWEGMIWTVVQFAALGGLVWILVRRVGRYKTRGEEVKEFKSDERL
ncbi:MAG: hypothetical protein HOH77_01475 [Candidatus Latescibacteria bacterium]|nr:hypothetical protein [Candidatus Latescibacterota bacterium]